MGDILANQPSGVDSGNPVAEIISATQSLAESIGPMWGVTFLLVILLFLPKYGVVVNLASLIKEDRSDARKRKVEAGRLVARLKNRTQNQTLPPPKRDSRKGQ